MQIGIVRPEMVNITRRCDHIGRRSNTRIVRAGNFYGYYHAAISMRTCKVRPLIGLLLASTAMMTPLWHLPDHLTTQEKETTCSSSTIPFNKQFLRCRATHIKNTNRCFARKLKCFLWCHQSSTSRFFKDSNGFGDKTIETKQVTGNGMGS